MKTTKRLISFLIVLTIVVCQLCMSVSALEFSVSFDADYAKVGTPLNAVVTGADSGNVTYSWKVGNSVVGSGSSYTPKTDDLQKFITVTATDSSSKATAEAKLFFSKLPVVYIDTEDGQAVTSKETYKNADMKIQGSDAYSGGTYNGLIEIKGRGNSTWGWAKKPYKIKLDKKTDLFGMGKNKHWVLLANYIDRSLMRNSIAVKLADSLDVENMSTIFVDVVFNGSYVGNYQLGEQIRVDSTRVDITDWESVAEDDLGGVPEDLSKITKANGYDTTGGYLLEINAQYDEVSRFTTNNGVKMTFKSPEYTNTNDEMMSYVRNYIQDYENACLSTDFYNSKNQHYSDLFEFEDLINYWLANEFMNNVDTGRWSSTYMYKDTGGDKFHMGPVWDFDYSSGNPLHTEFNGYSCPPDHWQYGQEGLWYSKLVGDPYFVTRLQERYWETHDKYEATIPLLDDFSSLLQESGVANHSIWGFGEKFPTESARLRTWLQDRINWMDKQFATVDGGLTSLNVYKGDSSITFDVQSSMANSIAADDAEIIPADYVLTTFSDVTVTASIPNSSVKNAAFYLNGLRYGGNVTVANGKASITISQEDLIQGESKNVIQVRGINSSGSFVNTSYITLKNEATNLLPAADTFKWPVMDKSGVYYGASLDEIPFKSVGKALYINENSEIIEVEGTFSWDDGSIVPPVGTSSYGMTFTPTDTETYQTIRNSVSVTITKPVTAALSKLYNENADRVSSDYTPESWSVFSKALDAAKSILGDKSATQQQLDKIKSDLQAAINGLVEIAGFSIEAPVSAIKNEKFTIKVTTDPSVTKLIVYNENKGKMGTKVVSKNEYAGSTEWEISLSIGTAGEGRILTVCDQNSLELGTFTLDVINASQISNIVSPSSAAASEKFTITVTATSDISQIKIYNERNAVIGSKIISKSINNGIATFVVELSIGTPGSRVITVKGNGQYAKSFNIDII